MSTEAERLKDEGNTLYINKDFAGAYEKYTQAIRHDDKNAVLYSNRAAASLALNRYAFTSISCVHPFVPLHYSDTLYQAHGRGRRCQEGAFNRCGMQE